MSDLMIPLTNSGFTYNLEEKVIGKVTCSAIKDKDSRKDYIWFIENINNSGEDYSGYSAIVTSQVLQDQIPAYLEKIPVVHSSKRIDHVIDDDIVSINPQSGFMRTLYRVKSRNNVIFATDRCNSLCLMCSQPPKKKDDSEKINDNLRMLSLIDPKPEFIGISGGEPTLLKEGLFKIKQYLKDSMPDTAINMLTNGRMFYYEDFTREYASIGHKNFCAAIPLYSDIPELHDEVVQAEGAFYQTVKGIYNLAVYRQPIEIRVVIHKLTYKRLLNLAKYIYLNFPFVAHIALMGLEIMGYTKKNLDMLWIDSYDYQKELYEAVNFLDSVKMNVSIYNHQLCVLKRELWPFARKSISDYKNIYLEECSNCDVLDKCGGLFKSAENVHSKHIHAIKL